MYRLRLYHYPMEREYYFLKKPTISDMVRILKKLGYNTKGNKILCDNNKISCKHAFQISKIKFEDKCDCNNCKNQCCDICTGWAKAELKGTLKDKK